MRWLKAALVRSEVSTCMQMSSGRGSRALLFDEGFLRFHSISLSRLMLSRSTMSAITLLIGTLTELFPVDIGAMSRAMSVASRSVLSM